MADPLVSVVIPNWNGAAHLPTCLDALRGQRYPRLEVIVADNASTDGSQALLAERYPEVRLVALPENRASPGPATPVLPPPRGDHHPAQQRHRGDPRWLAEVMAAFARHPQVGLRRLQDAAL
jgi:cellulose synthase/poly-beta-1,6-N-acetylglucosamine synthase-like glycosyltransferase